MTKSTAVAILTGIVFAVVLVAVVVICARAGVGSYDHPVTSLVCGEEGATYQPGWTSCLSAEEWRCVRARDRCARSPFHPGCQATGYADIDLDPEQYCIYPGPGVIGFPR